MKKEIKAGMAVRRKLRRLLLRGNIPFTEDKGFLDSLFIVEVNDYQWKQLVKIIDYFNN